MIRLFAGRGNKKKRKKKIRKKKSKMKGILVMILIALAVKCIMKAFTIKAILASQIIFYPLILLNRSG